MLAQDTKQVTVHAQPLGQVPGLCAAKGSGPVPPDINGDGAHEAEYRNPEPDCAGAGNNPDGGHRRADALADAEPGPRTDSASGPVRAQQPEAPRGPGKHRSHHQRGHRPSVDPSGHGELPIHRHEHRNGEPGLPVVRNQDTDHSRRLKLHRHHGHNNRRRQNREQRALQTQTVQPNGRHPGRGKRPPIHHIRHGRIPANPD